MIVIIGAGPTGLSAATLLGQYGIECLVLERWDSVYPMPRAVHLDDEVHRVLARLGIADSFAAISRPCLGLRLVGPDLKPLAEFHRARTPGRNGFPEANLFDQPELEALLRVGLKNHHCVTLRGNAEVTGIHQDSEGDVRVDLIDHVTGAAESVSARFVLGCDGANSTTRAAIGATMRDLGFSQRWLAIDIETSVELPHWEGVHQVCSSQRAATYMRVGSTRHRWEFQLTADESADDYQQMGQLYPLLAPWLNGVPADSFELVRVAEYTFRAQVADVWRDRRVFLLGDAAHLTPPFIGQGMGAGVRDAVNLSWKLAAVLSGTLPESVLDSYRAEREPHVRAAIQMSRMIGTVMTRGGKVADAVRSALVPRLYRMLGRGRQRLFGSETPPLRRSSLVEGRRLRRTLAGRLCPNVLVDGARLDLVAAGRFVVVTRQSPSPDLRVLLDRHAVLPIVARPGDVLHRWLGESRTGAALVRPDGVVLHAGKDLAAVCRVLVARVRAPGVARLTEARGGLAEGGHGRAESSGLIGSSEL
jgi:3-(3-hydroxy-phenyl)propionate hydroxylase